MTKKLIIVESPAKAKTIKKYLGKDTVVLASYGHVRDLLPKKGAIDPTKKFAMQYELIEKNAKHVQAIINAFKTCDELYLATDPDREGEAIAWHLFEILKTKRSLKNKPIFRAVFNEITAKAVKEAIANPREISMDLVNAQQARRALDYLVGFNLSPLLWKKVRRGLSAGRVQSPALGLIVEREEEIERFVAQEYWSITAHLEKKGQLFLAKIVEFEQKKLNQFSVTNGDQALQIKITLEQAAKGNLIVQKIEKKQRKKNPQAPFTTSSLQQEGSYKLGFNAQRTMRIAQQLYEGIDVGNGAQGLITYMRTDSVILSNDSLDNLRELIRHQFGSNHLPNQPRRFRNKSKNAQEAHEAIRPTDANLVPLDLKKHLNPEQFKLYELIWKRTVASQMNSATIDTVAVDLSTNNKEVGDRFRANGSTITYPGFMLVYQSIVSVELEKNSKESADTKLLPLLELHETVSLQKIEIAQHFTEPAPRFNEASLVKSLEEFGIGRPSTYVPIISTLQYREYVTLEQKQFKPTEIGRIVNKFLKQYFNQYVDYNFTAKLEDELDVVAKGKKSWLPLLQEFWGPFKQQVEEIEKTVERKDITQEIIEEKCPKCNQHLSIRLGKHGRFIGCIGFPECDFTRNLADSLNTPIPSTEIVEGRVCPKCQSSLHIRLGRYGKFIGCSSYPKCKYIEPLEKAPDTGINCPVCKLGTLRKNKSRYGKFFYSCSTYPTCKYAIWNEPLNEACPKCHWPVLTIKVTQKHGTNKVCPQKECQYSEPMD